MNTSPDERASLLREKIGWFLLGCFLVTSLGILVECLPIGHRLNYAGYAFLQPFMQSFNRGKEPEVIVLDISELAPAVPQVGDQPIKTSRKRLALLMDALIQAKPGVPPPAAIGVDIDFSPGAREYKTDADDEIFFQRYLNSDVPVYLGVERAMFQSEDRWLYLPDYKTLAAALPIPLHETDRLRLPLSVRYVFGEVPGNTDAGRLRTMSFHLANAYAVRRRTKLPDASPWIAWALEKTKEERLLAQKLDDSPRGTVELSACLMNYSKLTEIRREAVSATSPVTVRDLASKFAGKVVLLGATDPAKSDDKFDVYGVGNKIPGVFLHACAVHTLVQEPVWETTFFVNILLDNLVAAIFFFPTIFPLLKRTSLATPAHEEEHDKPFDWKFAIIKSLVVVALAALFAHWLSFLWLAWPFILLGNIFDLVYHQLHISAHRIWNKKPVAVKNPVPTSVSNTPTSVSVGTIVAETVLPSSTPIVGLSQKEQP